MVTGGTWQKEDQIPKNDWHCHGGNRVSEMTSTSAVNAAADTMNKTFKWVGGWISPQAWSLFLAGESGLGCLRSVITLWGGHLILIYNKNSVWPITDYHQGFNGFGVNQWQSNSGKDTSGALSHKYNWRVSVVIYFTAIQKGSSLSGIFEPFCVVCFSSP